MLANNEIYPVTNNVIGAEKFKHRREAVTVQCIYQEIARLKESDIEVGASIKDGFSMWIMMDYMGNVSEIGEEDEEVLEFLRAL